MNKVYVVRNVSNAKCQECGGIHEYVTQRSKDRGNRCDTPLGMAKIIADDVAKAIDGKSELPGEDVVVVLHESARKLPQGQPDLAVTRESIATVIPMG